MQWLVTLIVNWILGMITKIGLNVFIEKMRQARSEKKAKEEIKNPIEKLKNAQEEKDREDATKDIARNSF